MMNRYFADISNNNPGEKNFRTYRNVGGHGLVGLKSSESTDFVDSFHAGWSEQAHKAGVWVLHYHFGHVARDAFEQAEFFWRTIRSHFATRFIGTDFACIDMESMGLDGHSEAEAAFWVNRFAEHFKAISGHSVIGYCSASMLADMVDAGLNFPGKRWWIAAYGQQFPPVVRGVRTWAWQFTDGREGINPHHTAGIGPGDVSALNGATLNRLRMQKAPV